MDGWTDRWTNGRMDRWMGARTHSPCILQDIVPFGSAAQKGREEKEGEGREKWVRKQTNYKRKEVAKDISNFINA